MNDWLRSAVAALATWRVTHLVAREDGPWDVIARTRKRAGESFWGKLMDCFYCLSLWVSAAITLTLRPALTEGVLLWLALSAAACLLERIGANPVTIEPIPPHSEE